MQFTLEQRRALNTQAKKYGFIGFYEGLEYIHSEIDKLQFQIVQLRAKEQELYTSLIGHIKISDEVHYGLLKVDHANS